MSDTIAYLGRQLRARTRASLRTRGAFCECCINRDRLAFFISGGMSIPEKVKATDLHELIRKGNIPRYKQEVLFMRGNVLFLCRACHTDAAWAIHGTAPDLWAIPLLLLVRSKKEIKEFIDKYHDTFKLDHPFIKLVQAAQAAVTEKEYQDAVHYHQRDRTL